jgi:NAD+ diphosphatase
MSGSPPGTRVTAGHATAGSAPGGHAPAGHANSRHDPAGDFSGPTDPSYAFVAGALDRADALRDDPAALDALWPGAGVVEVDPSGRVEAAGAVPHWPRGGALLPARPDDAVFLGLDRDGRGWFARARAPIAEGEGEGKGTGTGVPASAPAPAPAPARAPAPAPASAPAGTDLRTAAAAWPAFDATVFAQARAVLHWQARHRHCGACGKRLSFGRGGWLGHCEGCGLDHYPRTDPAVSVAVDDGERLLLGRQRGWAPGRWSVIAGFVEPGESLEQTVAREVHEETAVRVHDCRYLGSQPWPFPSALMLGFLARAEPQVPVAGDELEAVRWFDAEAVRAGLARDWNAPPEAGEAAGEDAIVLSPPLSIARWLIESWLAAHDSRRPARNP